MDSDMFMVPVLVTLGLGGFAIGFGAWLPRAKKMPDWFMAVGGTLAIFAFGFLIAMLTGAIRGRGASREIVGMGLLSSLSLGVLLFSMGYVMDRWQRRTQQIAESHRPPE